MEIPVGKYVITSDSLNVTLNEKRKVKEGKKKGEEYLQPIAYYSSVESCLEGIIDHEIIASKSESLEELLREIKKISKFIRSEFKKARGKDKNDTRQT